MTMPFQNGSRKSARLVAAWCGVLFIAGVGRANAQPPATQPAGRWKAPLCHETTLSLPKIPGPLRGDEKTRGETTLREAVAAMRVGNVGEQRKQAAQAAALFLAAGEKSREAAALRVMGAADEELGHYGDALCELEESASISDAAHDRAASAATHSSLGALETLTRCYEDASFDLDRAGKEAEEGSDARTQAGVFNNLGNLNSAMTGVARSRVEDLAEDKERDKLEADTDQALALKDFDRAIELADQCGDKTLAAKAATNGMVAAARDLQFDEAAHRGGAAFDRVRALPDSREKAYLLTTIGQIDSQIADHRQVDQSAMLKQASTAFNSAVQAAQATGDTVGESYATGMCGHLDELHGSAADALVRTRRAIFLAQKAQSPDSLYLWQWQMGRLLYREGAGRDESIAAYTRAFESLQSVRSDIAVGHGNGDTRSSFRKDVGPLYFQMADLLLRRAEDSQRSPDDQRADLLQARDVVERLKTGELEDYFQDDCVSQTRFKPKQIAALDTHTAVLYVIPLADRIELLLDLPVDSHGAAPVEGAGLVARRKEGVSSAQLEEVVKSFRSELVHLATNGYITGAGQLYEWLIRPIEPLLKAHQIQTLVFVPDGPLRTIPMAALYDAQAGQFLIEQYATGVTPGLTLMEPKALTQKSVRLLASGLSVSREGFAALPSVPGELASIRNAFPAGSKELLNQQFVIGAFGSEIRDEPYTIVHIASHGEFKGDARETFILTYDHRLSLPELQTLIQPSQFRGRPVELLTLSACSTAVGDDRAALGLAGVAIKAGARSALASLWSVNDASTGALIADFYHELRANPGISKAQALQRAQLRFIRSDDLSHPKFWAPFILIGNWL